MITLIKLACPTIAIKASANMISGKAINASTKRMTTSPKVVK